LGKSGRDEEGDNCDCKGQAGPAGHSALAIHLLTGDARDGSMLPRTMRRRRRPGNAKHLNEPRLEIDATRG
jgi:hypothetical protein